MTQHTRTLDMIPLWLQISDDGSSATLSLEKGENGILLHEDNRGDFEAVLGEFSLPSFLLFDMPSEARAAAAAINALKTDSFGSESPVAGRTLNGEGLLMVFGEGSLDIDGEKLQVTDHRTQTGYQLPVYLSWELQACECDSALLHQAADRIDLAFVLCKKIEETANPAVVRSLQSLLQKLPGASVGLPLLEMSDLQEDIELYEEIDSVQLQAALIRYADKLDCSDPIDALARHLLETFPGQFRQKLHADEPMI
ncbi:hypothetical protein KUV57_12025 [Epibacterium sp. DP7N7-1]|nr:hypothetical protein [Epibacterium sp. DP7N7-1]